MSTFRPTGYSHGRRWLHSKGQLIPSTSHVMVDPATKRLLQESTPSCPKVFLAGGAKAGKTSLVAALFDKKYPHEASNVAKPTKTITTRLVQNTRALSFCIVDTPAAFMVDHSTDNWTLANAHSLIIVVDAQAENFSKELDHCKGLLRRASDVNDDIYVAVFIHKLDGEYFAVPELRAECECEVRQEIVQFVEQSDTSLHLTRLAFFPTSIFDHSAVQAFSQVIKNAVPKRPALERLLDTLAATCHMDKVFLIDVVSKLFVAADSSPSEPATFELCAELLETVINLSWIYGDVRQLKSTRAGGNVCPKPVEPVTAVDGCSGAGQEEAKPAAVAQPESPFNRDRPLKMPTSGVWGCDGSGNQSSEPETACIMQLDTGHIIYLREVGKFLSLACVIPENYFDRQYLVDYNVRVFRAALEHILEDRRPWQTMVSSESTSRCSSIAPTLPLLSSPPREENQSQCVAMHGTRESCGE